MPLPSEFDINYFPIHREFVNNFLQKVYADHLAGRTNESYLEIGPQENCAIKEIFGKNNKVASLDVTDDYKPDLVGDITVQNDHIASESFDGIFCMEVLEHVVDPFAAISEISRMLKDGGVLALSTPLNARIHGPVPDCWRFTEFGLRILLRNFDIKIFDILETPGRNLFPLHYAVLAVKNSTNNIDSRKMKFSYLT